jgi:hypothetical protein
LSGEKKHELADRESLLIIIDVLNEVNQLNDSLETRYLLIFPFDLAVVACLSTLLLREFLP